MMSEVCRVIPWSTSGMPYFSLVSHSSTFVYHSMPIKRSKHFPQTRSQHFTLAFLLSKPFTKPGPHVQPKTNIHAQHLHCRRPIRCLINTIRRQLSLQHT